MEVIWTNEALLETKAIYHYYKLRVSIQVAKSLKNKIFSATKNLSKQPRKGQLEELLAGKNEEFRYLVINNYKIIYKIF
jgi:plasmid stabilization system protein ParE